MNSDLASTTVMIVEDEDLLRWSMSKKLTSKGFNVLSAGSCMAAMDLADKTVIDVLISDYRLEDGSGDELARRLARRGRASGVIIMTGEAEAVRQLHLGEMELIDVMSKPVDMDKLLAHVKDWTGGGKSNATISHVGAFLVCRCSASEDPRIPDGVADNIALVVPADASDEFIARAVELLSDVRKDGHQACLVCSETERVESICSEAGIECVAGELDLEAVSRRLVTRPERDAVLSITKDNPE